MDIISKEAEMSSMVELWKQSNQTKKDFAMAHGISYDSFRYWTHKLCPEESIRRTCYKDQDFSFIELTKENFNLEQSRTPQVELTLPNGIQLKIY
jgi:hypothetical protein